MREILLTVLAFSALAATGQADQIDESGWWFGGNPYAVADRLGRRVDPVNLLFYPGWFGEAEINEHFHAHIGRPANREPNEFIEHDNGGLSGRPVRHGERGHRVHAVRVLRAARSAGASSAVRVRPCAQRDDVPRAAALAVGF